MNDRVVHVPFNKFILCVILGYTEPSKILLLLLLGSNGNTDFIRLFFSLKLSFSIIF